MWLLLLKEIAFITFGLYVPGYFIVRLFNLNHILNISLAPLFSMVFLFFAARGLAYFCIPCNGSIIYCALLLFGVVCAPFSILQTRRHHKQIQCANNNEVVITDLKNLFLLIVLSSIVCLFVYILPLDSAGSFFQGFDNYSHISRIRTYLNTGFFSDVELFSYPCLWHSMIAIAATLIDSNLLVAANAFNIVLLVFVCPIGTYAFLRTVFGEAANHSKEIMFASVFVIASSTAYPWNYVIAGPLYALFVGWAVLAPTMAVFLTMIDQKTLSLASLKLLILFLLFSLLAALAHPSCIFAGIVLLTPACISKICNSQLNNFKKWTFSALFIVLVIGVWYTCYISPQFNLVVSFNWGQRATLIDALHGTLIFNLYPRYSAQIFLSLFVLIGSIYAWSQKDLRWLIVSLTIAGIFYIVSMAVGGETKNLLTGFWYTDQNRLAALYSFAAIPLGSLGLWVSARSLSRFFEIISLDKKGFIHTALALLLIPLFVSSLPGLDYNFQQLTKYNDLSTDAFCYDGEEVKFVDEAKSLVGDSDVLNYPYDGSLYSYAVNNLNIVNMSWWQTDYTSDDPLTLLRTRVDKVSEDNAVIDACRELRIKYILILDYGHLKGDGVFNYEYRVDEAWAGLTSIRDTTPGLKILLSNGDMRLYEIEGVE